MSSDEQKSSATTVGLIGHGYWGPNLLRNYMGLPQARLKWVCDLSHVSLEKAQRAYPAVQTTVSVDDVLSDPEVEAVLIATPISTHHRLCKEALQAGKHVFVEKPLTASARECVELKALAAQNDLTLMVGHTFLYSPPVRKVKELIDSGELGDVRYVTMQRVNLGLHQRDVSVIWDLAAHDISILDYWVGELPSAVDSVGRDCMQVGIPDVAFLNLKYRSGLVALVNVSWLSPVKLRRTVIVGSRKMIVYDDTAPVEKVKVFDHGADFVEPASFDEFQMVYRTGDIVSPKIENTEPLRLEAEHFLHSVCNGHRPVTDGEMGLRVVAVLDAAEASLREGGSKAVERRQGPADRRLHAIHALAGADPSLRHGISRPAGCPERRRRADRRLRMDSLKVAGARPAGGGATPLPEQRDGSDREAAVSAVGAVPGGEPVSEAGA
jgi:predicted dehydrogenase